MNPQEKSKKTDSTEYGHPRLNLTAFFGQGRGGGGAKFRAVPNQANQQHVQNGALRLRGIWIPKKKPNSTLDNPFCTGLSSAYVFLGAWIYNMCFLQKQDIFEDGLMIL